MGSFSTSYNVGGVVDKVKNINKLENVEKIDKVESLETVSNVNNIDSLGVVNNISNIDNLQVVEEIGKIRGFATKEQPYNVMSMVEIPAIVGEYEHEMDLPPVDIEVLAISLTCSGYGEDDHYDLYFNDNIWFKDWYCSEIKEGLFIGTSTYVYAAPYSSKIKLVFKNDSGTSKKVWLGVRMLIDSLIL